MLLERRRGDFRTQREAVNSMHLVQLLRTTKQTANVHTVFDLERQRTKRSAIFHAGVRICPQETISEVIASHQAYYKLRGRNIPGEESKGLIVVEFISWYPTFNTPEGM